MRLLTVVTLAEKGYWLSGFQSIDVRVRIVVLISPSLIWEQN
jgi:hypothetical protein